MEKTRIEWSDSTFNPISGCRHGCKYCYARRIANRFSRYEISDYGTAVEYDGLHVLESPVYGKDKQGIIRKVVYPYGFEPTFHKYRLDELKTKKFGKTIFVCSMADLFGEWVPDEWIEEVLNACVKSPEHRYLFLTKNPARYLELAKAGKLPELENFWYGSTITNIEMPYFYSEKHKTFLSIEPILESFKGKDEATGTAEYVDWAILGAETGNRTDKVIPKREWIEDIVDAFRESGKPMFMKDSMKDCWGDDIITQTPWDSDTEE